MDIQMTWNLEDLFASAGEWEIGLQKAKELFEHWRPEKDMPPILQLICWKQQSYMNGPHFV